MFVFSTKKLKLKKPKFNSPKQLFDIRIYEFKLH